MTGSYDYRLVTLSVVIAVCAAYAALDLAGRMAATQARARLIWLSGGAAAMGLGIWSMHYIGMLAFQMPVPVAYDWPTVLLSLLAAICASAVALFVARQSRMNWNHAIIGGTIMGAGIVSMHYIGMAAMRLPAECNYDMLLVTLSVAIAIGFSLAALWLSFHLREAARATWRRKGAGSIFMGTAIAAMHYTGMAAANFTATGIEPDLSHAVQVTPLGIAAITSITLLVLGFVSLTSVVDRRFAAQRSALKKSEMLQLQLEHAIERLKASEAQLRVLIETIPALAWTTLPDGSGDFVNRRWIEFTGLSLEDLRAAGPVAPFHPDDAATHAKKWRSALETGDSFENEARIRSVDGEYRWFLIRGMPLRDERGDIVKWYGTMTDIEDRKRAEEALSKFKADLAHLNRVATVGEFAASIAHEVSQPLAAIIASGDSCTAWLNHHPPNLDKARAAADRMVKSAIQASEVVHRVRTLFKKAPLEKTALQINDVIEEAVRLTETELGRKSVVLRTDLARDAPPVLGDRVQLVQVLLNLMVNAAEAMLSVECDCRSLLVQSRWQPGEVHVTVADTGLGIDESHLERLFDPFFTTKADGLGMGLSICRSIIEAHEGRLWASRNEPRGAIFQFVLPDAHDE